MFKVNNKNTRTTSVVSFSGVYVFNFEHISHLFLVFLLLIFEQVNISWEIGVCFEISYGSWIYFQSRFKIKIFLLIYTAYALYIEFFLNKKLVFVKQRIDVFLSHGIYTGYKWHSV